MTTLEDLAAAATTATEPSLIPPSSIKPGGVDPLGLRQINFDLMDQVLPGLNNVARHIRPFVVVTWAWRRAARLAEAQGLARIAKDDLRDFVDRIEVIFAWSLFKDNSDADLPGRQVLASIVQSDRWTFGGDAWRRRREARRNSTAFTAAITYGPGLRALGWLNPHPKYAGVLAPTDAASPALDAFEALIEERLGHPAFSQFGSVEVAANEVLEWANAWRLENVTEAEKRAMREMLFGSLAPIERQRGGNLMLAAVTHASTAEVDRVRSTMAGEPSDFAPALELSASFEAWRRVQVRQLFRLSLEALFYWVLQELKDGPRTTTALVDAFVRQGGVYPEQAIASSWLDAARLKAGGPTGLLHRIVQALDSSTRTELVPSIADAIVFCLKEAPANGQAFERPDRLPLSRARREAEARVAEATTIFVRHILESWVLAQHVYWSVGRGLADARASGKTILRLKVILDEGGWALLPGALGGSPPAPTPDRLQTALSLANECGLFTPIPT